MCVIKRGRVVGPILVHCLCLVYMAMYRLCTGYVGSCTPAVLEVLEGGYLPPMLPYGRFRSYRPLGGWRSQCRFLAEYCFITPAIEIRLIYEYIQKGAGTEDESSARQGMIVAGY